METQTSAVERGGWYERRAARWVWVGALAVGVGLLGVGLFGFLSAQNTDDDARATKDQVAALQAETADLEQQRSKAEEDASAANDEARSLEDATRDVKQAALELENTMATVTASSNALVACDQPDLAAFHVCTRTELESFKSATEKLVQDTAHLRDEVSKLKEGPQ